MKKPHKHAELIHLWADGADIQYRHNENEVWSDINYPAWDASVQYRVKPEPKPDVVILRLAEMDGQVFFFREAGHWERNNVRFIFDGETGKLKSAEIL